MPFSPSRYGFPVLHGMTRGCNFVSKERTLAFAVLRKAPFVLRWNDRVKLCHFEV